MLNKRKKYWKRK